MGRIYTPTKPVTALGIHITKGINNNEDQYLDAIGGNPSDTRDKQLGRR